MLQFLATDKAAVSLLSPSEHNTQSINGPTASATRGIFYSSSLLTGGTDSNPIGQITV